jgi:Carboxypeptidase regulatory-like domain/TonB dependent receptor
MTAMVRSIASVVLALCFVPALLLAQSDTATVSGLVTDSKDAVLVGAQVRATNVDAGTSSTALTNRDGVYVLRDLRPGQYRLTVDNEGFQQIVLVGLILSAQDAVGRNFTMQVGSIIQSVTLTASGEKVNISPAVGTVVNQQFVQNLPLNGRSFQSLIGLTPGVVFVPLNDAGSGEFSINGQRANANYFTVDGVSANFAAALSAFPAQTLGGTTPALTVSGGTNGLLSVDAMQEFRVQTSTFAPENGRSPAQVSIVTRSGTDQFHGTVYDYLRNNFLDARNYFDRPPLPIPPLRQNDFGGTLGGPILRNRTFFFFSYEGLRLLLPQTAIGNFYTAAARQSVAPAYQPLMAAMPLPDGPVNSDGLTAPLTVGYSDPTSLNATSLRIDHTINQHLNLFGRYNHAPSEQSTRLWSEESTFTGGSDSATLGATFVLTSGMVNDFRANWSRNTAAEGTVLDSFHGAVPPPDSAMYPPGYNSKTNQFVLIPPLPLDTDAEVRSGPLYVNVQKQLNFLDNFSLTAGAHQLKFGADFRHLNPATNTNSYDLLIQVHSYASLQAGKVDSVFTTRGSQITTAINNYSFFVQDIWKSSPRLTLTYGVRWEINTPMHSITAGKPLYAVTGVFDSAPFGLAPAGTPLWHTRFDNFAPRFGATFQLAPQTVLRGGFGRYYDLGYGGNVAGTMFYFPYMDASLAVGPLPFDFNNAAFQAPPFTLAPNSNIVYIAAVDPNLKVPFTYEWNAAIQRGLGANQSISATYVGAHGDNLLRGDVIGSSVGYRTQTTRNADWSNYNALQLQFQRRMARGFQALVSYTFAKSTDTNSDDTEGNDITNSLRAINVAADLAPSDFDVRHSFSTAVSWQIPSPHWERLSDALLRNWQADGIVRISSAAPYQVFIRARPNVVPGVPFYLPAPGEPGGRTLNPAAFTPAPPGQNGDLPRNFFRGFAIDQTDLSLRRQFHLTERASLFLGMEYFNLFNHPMFAVNEFTGFGPPTQTLNEDLGLLNPLYQIGGPRSGQLTIKVLF